MRWVFGLVVLQGCVDVTVSDAPAFGEDIRSIMYVVRSGGTCKEPGGTIVHREIRPASSPSTAFDVGAGSVTFALPLDVEEREAELVPACGRPADEPVWCGLDGDPLAPVVGISILDVLDIEPCGPCPSLREVRPQVALGDDGRPQGVAPWDETHQLIVTSHKTLLLDDDANVDVLFDFVAESFHYEAGEVLIGGPNAAGPPTLRIMHPPDSTVTEEIVDNGRGGVRAIARRGDSVAVIVIGETTEGEELSVHVRENGVWSRVGAFPSEDFRGEDVDIAFASDRQVVVAGDVRAFTVDLDDPMLRPLDVERGLPPFSALAGDDERLYMAAGSPARLFTRTSTVAPFSSIGASIAEAVDTMVAYRGGLLIGASTWFGVVRFEPELAVCELGALGIRITAITDAGRHGVFVGGRLTDETTVLHFFEHL